MSSDNTTTQLLQKYLDTVKRELRESVIPFWLNNSVDYEFGGYFNCLDRDGKHYDTKKHIWLQARQVWMLSKLYNTVPDFKTKQILEAARAGAEFLRNKARRPEDNRVYFSLTREGKPLFIQRKLFSECFFIIALAEFSKASGESHWFDDAISVYGSVISWAHDPTPLGRPQLEGQPKMSELAVPMIILNVIDELRGAMPSGKPDTFEEDAKWCVKQILKHVHKERKLVFETVMADGSLALDSIEGRVINPGHAIECGWFLLNYALKHNDEELKKTAIEMVEWSFEFGWDKEYDGLYYFLDSEGYSPTQLEWSMKLWWPHCEAMVAFLMMYKTTRDPKHLESFGKVFDYSFKHFSDPEYGEWFGYCDRQGNQTHRFKGSPYKGCFHVPRALYLCEKLLVEILGGSDATNKQ